MSRLAALPLMAWMTLPAQAPATSVVVHGWVEEATGKPARELTGEDVEIRVDGQLVRVQSVAPRQTAASIVLLLDATRSTMWTPRPLAEQLGSFSSSLEPRDRLMLGTIDEKVAFSSFRPATHDIRSEVRHAVEDGAEKGAGNSPIWDAIHDAVTRLAAEPPPRMILLVSDGRATGNRHGLIEVADYAMEHGVIINIVLRHTTQRIRQSAQTAAIVQPEAPLEALTALTGGVLFFYPLFQDEQARARFAHIAASVRALHSFTFTPPVRDGRSHRLEIRPTRPDLDVHAPLAFLAR